MVNPFTLEGKTILVIGASSGIGRATAIICATLGASVMALGRNETRLNETLTSMAGNSHRIMKCDITNEEEVKSIIAGLDKVDGVAFSAGIQETSIVKQLNREVLDRLFETNFFSIASFSTQFLKQKKLKKNSSIVFVSSLASSVLAEVGNAAYSSTKGALTSFSRVSAKELVSRGIRVNTVSPGMIKTPLLAQINVSDEEFKENEKKYPLGYGEPDDVACAIAYLLSGASKWITGLDLKIDGGLTL